MEQDQDDEKPLTFDIAALDTYVLLSLFINILSSKAWQHLGIRVKPGTETVERDLERAKIAIDCIAFLIDKLDTQLQDSEKKRLRNLLTDLQINFVRITDTAK
jgi:hypothetical protein